MPFSLKPAVLGGGATAAAGRAAGWGAALLGAAVLLSACQPTVRVEAPKDPIVINLNVKIEQEVRVRVERDVEDLLQSESDLF